MMVVDRRFTSGHRMVGGDEEDQNNHGQNQLTDFMRKKIEDVMAEDKYIRCLGMDRRLLVL
jgi:hypothetical protein